MGVSLPACLCAPRGIVGRLTCHHLGASLGKLGPPIDKPASLNGPAWPLPRAHASEINKYSPIFCVIVYHN